MSYLPPRPSQGSFFLAGASPSGRGSGLLLLLGGGVASGRGSGLLLLLLGLGLGLLLGLFLLGGGGLLVIFALLVELAESLGVELSFFVAELGLAEAVELWLVDAGLEPPGDVGQVLPVFFGEDLLESEVEAGDDSGVGGRRSLADEEGLGGQGGVEVLKSS